MEESSNKIINSNKEEYKRNLMNLENKVFIYF